VDLQLLLDLGEHFRAARTRGLLERLEQAAHFLVIRFEQSDCVGGLLRGRFLLRCCHS
jgi:hypothetical protein